MIGKNLAQEECNWPSKFQGMDFNIIKILSVSFNKVCHPGPFLVPASLRLAWKEQKSTARDEVECRDFLFFPRYGVFCDLLQYTRTLKRNLFVLYIK